MRKYSPRQATRLLHYFKENNIFLDKMRILACGAEAWTTAEYLSFKNIFLHKDALIRNTYGVAECAIDSVAYGTEKTPVLLNSLLPIGKPCPNVKLYILSPEKELPPIGDVGELYIGGLAVGRGYFNRPDLTKIFY